LSKYFADVSQKLCILISCIGGLGLALLPYLHSTNEERNPPLP